MNISMLAWACTLLAASQVTVNFAPDQPLPHIYTDEPLIIEFISDNDYSGALSVLLERLGGETESFSVPRLDLSAGKPYWLPLADEALLRGVYSAKVSLDNDEVIYQNAVAFMRVDRPLTVDAISISVPIDATHEHMESVLRNTPIVRIEIDANDSDALQRAFSASEAGFDVALSVSPSTDPDHQIRFETLVTKLGDRVTRWEFVAIETHQELPRYEQIVRRIVPRATTSVRVATAQQLSRVVHAGRGFPYPVVTIETAYASAPHDGPMARTLEELGYEGTQFHSARPPQRGTDHLELIRNIVADFAAGYRELSINAATLYEENLQAGFPAISGLVHRLSGFEYAGTLHLDADWRAEAFRTTSDNSGKWLVVMWSEGEALSLRFDIDSATDLRLSDEWNTAVNLAAATQGVVTFPLGAAPRFLSGHGGNIIARATTAEITRLATLVTLDSSLGEWASPEIIEVLFALREATPDTSQRSGFLSILRAFPKIEERWHDGSLRQSVAVPALARLARLARRICILEHEVNRPFIEPLRETLTRCGQFQSLYVTGVGSSANAPQRGEWLLDEVTRLIDEAQRLVDYGRTIEANGVAAIAEWRARSLEFAAHAKPLGIPDPAPEQ